MKLYALEIPESPAELAPWLEQHLAGCCLRELAAELAAVHGGWNGAGLSLADVMGPDLQRVCQNGLADVPAQTLRQLLRNPGLLLDLQDQILQDGGSYWDGQVALTPSAAKAVLAGQRRLMAQTRKAAPPAQPPVLLRVPWLRRPWVAGLAAAAAVLVAVLLFNQFRPSATWGWNRPEAFANDLTAVAYLQNLADEAKEWFDQRPDGAKAIAHRIGEFREGCTRLLLTEYTPLAAADLVWLHERCRAWAVKFDEQRDALERGENPIKIRDQADQTVQKLIDALRKKALEIQA